MEFLAAVTGVVTLTAICFLPKPMTMSCSLPIKGRPICCGGIRFRKPAARQREALLLETLNEDRQYKLKVDNDLNVKIEAVDPASAVR